MRNPFYFVTVTYPGTWTTDGRRVKADLNQLRTEWTRRFGMPMAVWKMESNAPVRRTSTWPSQSRWTVCRCQNCVRGAPRTPSLGSPGSRFDAITSEDGAEDGVAQRRDVAGKVTSVRFVRDMLRRY